MSGYFGNTSVDTNRNVGKFNLLVADRIVANSVDANNINNAESTPQIVTLEIVGPGVFVGSVFVEVQIELLSDGLAAFYFPGFEVTSINNGGMGLSVLFESVNSLPAEFIPSRVSDQFTPVFEVFPGPATFYNATKTNVNTSGQFHTDSPFGLFTGNGNQVGCQPFTYVYTL